MPRLAARSRVSDDGFRRTVMSRSSSVLRAVQVAGGEVTRALRGDSVAYQATGPSITVQLLAHDSTVSGAGASLSLEGTDYTGTADSLGRIRLSPVLAGRYRAHIRTAIMDLLDVPSVVKELDTREDTRVDSLELPTAHDALTSACPRDSIQDGEGLLHGRVRDERARAMPGIIVTTTWKTNLSLIGTRGGAYAAYSVRTLEAHTDGSGRWRMCGLPVNTALLVRVVTDSGSDLQNARLNEHALASVNLVLHRAHMNAGGLDISTPPVARALVEIVVQDDRGAPLPETALELEARGEPMRTLVTGRTGRALAPDVALGKVIVRARRIGFTPGEIAINVESATVTIPIVMGIASTPTLDTMRVVGAKNVAGRLDEFENRRRLHQATVSITREEIEKRNPVESWQMLRGIAGVTVANRDYKVVATSRRAMISRFDNEPCFLLVMVDGVMMNKVGTESGFNLQQLPPPDEIHGIEVFAGPAHAALLAAQTREITGRVTQAATGAPITEATVGLLGSQVGVRTNERGEYRLKIPAGGATVLVRAIGFKRATAQVSASQTTADFALDKDVLQLEGVTVTGQATTVDKRNASTAIASVTAEELMTAPAKSVEGNLAGKVVGATDLREQRRARRRHADPDPRRHVDPRPGRSALRDRRHHRLQRVDSRRSRVDLAVERQHGVEPGPDGQPPRRHQPERHREHRGPQVGGGHGHLRLARHERRRRHHHEEGQGGRDALQHHAARGLAAGHSPPRQPHVRELRGSAAVARWVAAGRFRGEGELQPGLSQVRLAGAALQQQYAVVRDPLLHLRRSRQHAILRLAERPPEARASRSTPARAAPRAASTSTRPSARSSRSAAASTSRTTSSRTASATTTTPASARSYAFGYAPAIYDLRAIDPTTGRPVRMFMNGGGDAAQNPFEVLRAITNNEDTWRQTANVRVGYALLSAPKNNIQLTYIGGVDRYQLEGTQYSPNYLQFESADGFLGTSQILTADSRLHQPEHQRRLDVHAGLAVLQLRADVGGRNDRNVVLQLPINVRMRGLTPTRQVATNGADIATANTIEEFRDQSRYFNEQVIALDEKLALTFGVRADRGTANGDREKYYSFPKYSASYRFVEPLSHFSSIVDEVKLRASFGKSGNRPNYGNRDVTISSGGVIGGLGSLVASTTLGNPAIKPEVMNEQEYGIDAAMFNGRVSLEGSIYRRKISDLLVTFPLPQSSGLLSQTINGGKMSTRGFEAGLNLVPISTKNLEWTFRTTYQHNVQMVDELLVPAFAAANSFGSAYGRNRIAVGTRPTNIWGNIPFSCINTTDAAGVVTNKTGADGLPCHRIYPGDAAIAGSTVRDSIIADANPTGQTSFLNTLRYKSFSLTTLLDWRVGGYTSTMTKNLWDEGGNSRDFDDPSPVAGQSLGDFRYSTFAAGNIATYIDNGNVPEAARGERVVPGADPLGRVAARPRAAHLSAGPQSLDEDRLLELRPRVQQLRQPELQPLHRPRALSEQPAVLHQLRPGVLSHDQHSYHSRTRAGCRPRDRLAHCVQSGRPRHRQSEQRHG